MCKFCDANHETIDCIFVAGLDPDGNPIPKGIMWGDYTGPPELY